MVGMAAMQLHKVSSVLSRPEILCFFIRTFSNFPV